MWKIVPVALALILLSGCKPGEETHDVDWYKAHSDERKAEIAKCENNPGELAKTPNCVNATQARHELLFDPNNHNAPSIN